MNLHAGRRGKFPTWSCTLSYDTAPDQLQEEIGCRFSLDRGRQRLGYAMGRGARDLSFAREHGTVAIEIFGEQKAVWMHLTL
jgi:hypothetical protein